MPAPVVAPHWDSSGGGESNTQMRAPGAPPPYYELPAGLMVPLVAAEDCDYLPLDPSKLVPIEPAPEGSDTAERVRAALDEYFNPQRPRDSEGWEEDGLSGFLDMKRRARKRRSPSRSRSPSPSDAPSGLIPPPRQRTPSPPRWNPGGLGGGGGGAVRKRFSDRPVAFVAKSAETPLDTGMRRMGLRCCVFFSFL